MSEHLTLPAPLRLIRTLTWSLIESVGLPIGVYAVVAAMAGRSAGMLAGLGVLWLAAAVRKVTSGTVPSLLTISLIVLTVQTVVAVSTGALWLFLLQFPLANLAMGVLFARTASGPNPLVAKLAAEMIAMRQPSGHHPGLLRFFQRATWLWAGIFMVLTAALAVTMWIYPAGLFLLLSTVATVVLVVLGAGASALWFFTVLRRLGLRVHFA